jgi:uncharacterized protein
LKIRIAWKGGEVIANLRDTSTSKQVLAALPCEGAANTWGDEVYFAIPVQAGLEADAQQVVEPGTVCYWVQGHSLALPFGPTPASKGSECRLANPCNVLGKIDGNPRELGKVKQGMKIRVEVVPEKA